MFLLQPPQVRDTEVFTRMPDRFRRAGVGSDWADANRGGQPTDSFLEGPVFDSDGNLFVSDIPFGRIFRIDPRGEWEQVAEWAGEPNGTRWRTPMGTVVSAGCYANHDPAGAVPADGVFWMYLTGQTTIWRTPDNGVLIAPVEGSLDRTTNQMKLIAEREYVVTYECGGFAKAVTLWT